MQLNKNQKEKSNNNNDSHMMRTIFNILKRWYSDFCQINMNQQNSLIPEQGQLYDYYHRQ